MLKKALIILMVIFPFIVIRTYSNESKRDKPQDSSFEVILKKAYPEFIEALDKGIAHFENSKELGIKSIGETFIPGEIMNNLLNDLKKTPVTEKNYLALKTLILANRKISLARCNNNVFDDKACFLGKKLQRKYFEELLINTYENLSDQKIKENILYYFIERENLISHDVVSDQEIKNYYHTKIRTRLLFLFCNETNNILKNILCNIVHSYLDLINLLAKEKPNCDLINCTAQILTEDSKFTDKVKNDIEKGLRDLLQENTKKLEELKKLPHTDSGSGLD